jgi:multidrug efflux pump subunit AcrA (membrane-fusion protein)
MKKVFFILIAIIFAISVFFAYKKFFPEPTIKVLETAKVERGNIRAVLVATGIIKPRVGAVVRIGTRATGTITEMKVRVGDRVKKGQLIAIIDDREIRQAIEHQKSALLSAQNSLLQIELTYPKRIREAMANYEYAKISYEREKELFAHEFTTKDAVDRAKSQFEALEANIKGLQNEYKTQLKIARANIKSHEALLRQQEIRLTYTKIYAPINGVVSDITTQEGETIVAGLQVANLVTVLDPESLEVWIYIDETDIGRVRAGQIVEYSVDTFPQKIFHGTIDNIYPQPVVKDNIVYYLAIVKIPRHDAKFLMPEMTAHTRITFDERKDILTAPNAAIRFERGKQVAYRVLGPDNVQKVELKIGIRGEDMTEIVTGLNEGDEVATKLILPAPQARNR